MKNDKLETNSPENGAADASGCGKESNGRGGKIAKKSKVIIFLAVAIAAVILLASSVMNKAETGDGEGLNLNTAKSLASEKASPHTDKANSSLWDKPLDSVASLNEVATEKDAVFLYLPAKGQVPDEKVKKEIEAAAANAESQGIRMAFFVLDEGSQDYDLVNSQVSVPCVLAMAYGTGKSAATTNITEANLMQSLVQASQTYSCAPGRCAI
ncbi:MAG TPA: hypothetical protein PKG66_07285 [Methanothrix sp.]|jgi:hypothetical protein|nr:hypothetical protein [Methanothrix sp.]